MTDLYLFLLNDDHNQIVECHKYNNVDIDTIDISPNLIYESSEETKKFRQEKGGYHIISLLYDDCDKIIDKNFISMFENFINANEKFSPDERCLESEYYMFGFLTNKFDYYDDDIMDEINVLLLNQIVGFEDEGEGVLNLRTTCTHNMYFYDNIEEITDNIDNDDSEDNE